MSKQPTPGPNGSATQFTAGWFKASRSDDAAELARVHPLALVLAWTIARRARWRIGAYNPYGLALGECVLGDHESYGMSEGQYRRAKAALAEGHFATFKPTTHGTVARLMDTRVFSVLPDAIGATATTQPATQPATNEEQRAKSEEIGQERTGVSPSETPPRSSRKRFREFVPKPKTAAEVLAYFKALVPGNPKIAVERTNRFITYNNARDWSIADWRSAADGFNGQCMNTGP